VSLVITRFLLAILAVVFGFMPVARAAESASPSIFDDGLRIGLGGGAAPDYFGSNDYQFLPLPYFSYKHEGFGLASSQFGVEADVLPFLGFDGGPIVRYNSGRKNVKDDFVDLLPEVDGTLEVGAYVSGGIPLSDASSGTPNILTARIEGTKGVSGGHDGSLFTGTLGLITPLSNDLTLISNVSASYMSKSYADSFFDISAAGSAASGLASYNAGAGFRDVGLGLTANYNLTGNLSLFALGRYNRIVGDAAKSPIVRDRGSANQFLAGAGLIYYFN
jgi:MipA family protein